ncbi:MAG: class I SAM-dependent methyltransferase [Anaerolineae bacterium]|nr:class I SAM-dependent methyltransferase [Anaerolineae bacterium]
MPLDHFALVAPLYDRVFGVAGSERLRRLLQLPVAGWLLDAGGGTGRIAHRLKDETGGLVVVDISAGMLAQTRGKNGFSASRARVQQLPFADDSFERIIAVDAWHHFGDQPGAARDLVRVLKPGGRLVIEDFNIDKLPVKLGALSENLLLMRSRFQNPRTMREMFAPVPGARVTVHDDHPVNYWVVVEKQP